MSELFLGYKPILLSQLVTGALRAVSRSFKRQDDGGDDGGDDDFGGDDEVSDITFIRTVLLGFYLYYYFTRVTTRELRTP